MRFRSENEVLQSLISGVVCTGAPENADPQQRKINFYWELNTSLQACKLTAYASLSPPLSAIFSPSVCFPLTYNGRNISILGHIR